MSKSLQSYGLYEPSSSVHGILQARILEWVVISYSRGSSQSRCLTCVFYIFFIGIWYLYYWLHLGNPCPFFILYFLLWQIFLPSYYEPFTLGFNSRAFIVYTVFTIILSQRLSNFIFHNNNMIVM